MSNRPKVHKSRSGSRPSGDAGARSNPLRTGLVIGVVVLVAVAVGVALLAGRDAEQQAQTDVAQVSDVSIEGAPLPRFEGEEPDPAMERRAPAFAATTFDGTEVSVLPGDGTAKVIGFFAHWCPHCQRELPRIVDWLANNQLPAGVEVIAVSTAVDPGSPNYPPSAWFAEEQWPAVVVRDSAENELGDAYGLRGFPYTVGLDADGRVVARVAGELNDDAWEFLVDFVAPGAG
ncbi:MAG: TlpA disulfide reductase family protein [Acidimicrobiaceae bacterium]|nr:TlpA disulfide reductase family protein [Acidimicrobiaceae bacterium]